MICTRCSTVNGNDDRFCCKCGAPLGLSQDDGKPVDVAALNATTMLAAREARLTDVKNMRPLTRVAYNIAESENASTINALVSVLYVVLALGMVAVLIKIFETINKLAQAMITSSIEGSLSERFYGLAAQNNTQLLGWLIALFVAMVAGFFACGKLRIRIKKVNRKKHKEQLDSRL